VSAGEGPGAAPAGLEPGAEAPARAAAGRESRESAFESLRTLVLAVALAFGIRACVVEPFSIPSGSMLPTLLIGDHLFVSKLAFGPKLPFTTWRLPGLREPRRGDVVVFSVARGRDGIFPADRRPDLPREDFVKRIVGLPGDRVELRDGVLVVNGEVQEQVASGETFRDEAGRALDLAHERIGAREHAVLLDPALLPRSLPPVEIEPGRYFLMGDNRDFSNDSRSWGTVRLEELEGPAVLLYWSWSFDGGWLELLNPAVWWSAEKRWSRIFQPVE
jgi:signal peptidase I